MNAVWQRIVDDLVREGGRRSRGTVDAMPELNQPGEPELNETELNATELNATEPADDAPISVRDRWWWSSAMSIVVGAVVVGFQWDSLTGPHGLWANWLVAAIGLAVGISGLVRLGRAYRAQSAR